MSPFHRNPMKNLLFFIVSSTVFFTAVSAQNPPDKAKIKFYQKNPVWIRMMDDSTVNYNEAKIAFEEFWKGKEEPEEEGYETNEKRKSLLARLFENDEDSEKYAFEHKRFENWLRTKAPYVKPDGTLMSDDEYLKLINEELRRRKEDASKL